VGASDRQGRRYEDAKRVLSSLEGAGYAARLAGGCVRDRLLGIEPQDYDVATDARPEQVTQHFRGIGARTVPTGIEHGTVTVVMASGPIEVTTLRTDVSTDGRRATVAFSRSFEDDAARRDFTINAMFEDGVGVVYDYHGGQADLAAKTLRFVGDASQRMAEDFLRILRLFRFWSRFGFEPAEGTLDAVSLAKAGLAKISQERITAELMKLVVGTHAGPALEAMVATGVWAIILPELARPAEALRLTPALLMAGAGEAVSSPRRSVAALATLVLGSGGVDAAAARTLGERLKLPTIQGKALGLLVEVPRRLAAVGPETADAMEFVDLCETEAGEGAFTDLVEPWLAAVAGAGHIGACGAVPAMKRVSGIEMRQNALRKQRPLLDGNELMAAAGLPKSAALGSAVAALKRATRNGEISTREEALEWVKQTYGKGAKES
jgi:poly(A) polymerase